jgi:hypothetical protein
MELEDLLTEAARLLGRFSAEVKAAGAASLNDIGVASDMFLVELLRETYDLQDLRNLNAEKANFPGLDLADDTAGVAFQVTSERDLPVLRLSEVAEHPHMRARSAYVSKNGRVQCAPRASFLQDARGNTGREGGRRAS